MRRCLLRRTCKVLPAHKRAGHLQREEHWREGDGDDEEVDSLAPMVTFRCRRDDGLMLKRTGAANLKQRHAREARQQQQPSDASLKVSQLRIGLALGRVSDRLQHRQVNAL